MKPKEEFKHVKILALSKLNNYIEYFDKILTDAEVQNVFNFLNNEMKFNT